MQAVYDNYLEPASKFPYVGKIIFPRQKKYFPTEGNLFSVGREFRGLFGWWEGLHQGGVDEGCGDGHEAGDADDQAAVAAEAYNLALDSLEDAAGDTHAVAFFHGHLGGRKIEQLFVLRSGHGNEVAHFAFGHGERQASLAVHIETHRDAAFQLLFETVDCLPGGMREEQIVHYGEQAFHPFPVAVEYDHLLHGQEIAYAFRVEVLFELELAAVRDTQDVPLIFGSGGKRRHSLQKVVFGGHRSLIFRGYPTFHLIG